MPQVQPTRLPHSRSTQSLRPSANGTPATPGHQRKPSLTRPPGTGLRPKPIPLSSHHPSGSCASSISTRSAIPSLGRLRPAPRPPTSSSNSSLSTTKEVPAIRPVRSLTTLRQAAKVEKGKTPAPLTAAHTGPAPRPRPVVGARSRPRATTLVENPETPPRSQKAPGKVPDRLVPNKTGERVKRTPSARSPVLSGARRVPAARGESTESLAQPSPPPKTTTTRSLMRRPLSLADRVFGGGSALKIAAKEKEKPAPSPFPSPLARLSQRDLRTSLRANSNTSPAAPKSPPPKSASPTAVKFSPAGKNPNLSEDKSFKLPLGKRTPAQRRIASTPVRTPAHSRRALPETPALSTFLRDQSTRIGQIGEEDISLASSTSFRCLTPPGHGSTDLEFVSAIAGPPATRARRPLRSPLSPTSPLSPRRTARPIATSTELRAELARVKNERVVLETRVAAAEAEVGRLTGLAEAALRDRQRALDRAENAEVAREAALWDAVVQAADEAIEEERALLVAIAAARAIVMAM
ncbi:hypothetical protein CcaverHIS002_0203480 [Cutaneotrichosporon cavernicola]|uniref:Uncharacterized protein n=1 Tax=Cutaneotrichosporon cavernicola TaxID=279322 RepID=A0AA48L126_9TREE|nr:uncharacterized protein CcaverHIS019_0203470 [Cutaneotrichosporon cavernicola]BEI81188.1 hypothetical protein CcaverHIS002_0203480 [Cutaneotrichosporon cavernicola]BEI88985.1 hypothetical protein CcaverHIS019_0203470 [Cutaneotrichosporon cavernicola]BEI96761.1 hypothetical protein CcaverHIS631_0203500 [Cutaneotrichosporon cavernicola]BEJ04533.1 hypothetical protein CcaverHIS641_0203500 [Cutaneotrichosporon cavernicola]